MQFRKRVPIVEAHEVAGGYDVEAPDGTTYFVPKAVFEAVYEPV